MRAFVSFATLLFFFAASGAAFAKTVAPTLLLMTALDPSLYPKGPGGVFHGKLYANYEHELEDIFRSRLSGKGYALKAIHKVDSHEIFQALHSPEYVGIFFVSHGGVSRIKPLAGLTLEPDRLVDYFGRDVRELFLQEAHPNRKWISVISCKSQQIMASGGGKGDRKPDVSAADKGRTDARRGLRKAIDLSKKTLFNSAITGGFTMPCEARPGIPLLINREIKHSNNAETPAVRIRVNGKIIATLRRSTHQSATEGSGTVNPIVNSVMNQVMIPAPLEPMRPKQLEIIVESGEYRLSRLTSEFQLGNFEFTAGNENHWMLNAIQGRPLGITSYSYRYSGPMNFKGQTTEYFPFDCTSVAALVKPGDLL